MRNQRSSLVGICSRVTDATTSDPESGNRRHGGEERLAKALGWFSTGLGLPQVIVPGRVNRLIGVQDTPRNRSIMRAIGVRELGGAAGILERPRPAGFLFARVVGDAIDLLLLGAALRARGNARHRVAATTAAVAGVAVLDVIASAKTSRSSNPTADDGAIRVRAAITVNRGLDEVYRFWHHFQNLPNFMEHVESVQVSGDGRSHWVAKGPAGTRIEWDAQIVEDVADELIAWRSIEDAAVSNSGCVRFRRAPGDRGTEVAIELEYQPPASAIGAAVTRLFGEEPLQQIKDDLRRFKQAIETGEVVRSDGTPEGTRARRQFSQQEAQPSE